MRFPALLDPLGAALDLRDAHVLARELLRFHNRSTWRRAAQLRASRIATVVRQVERAVGDSYVARLKQRDGSWHVHATSHTGELVLVAIVGGGPRHTLDDLRAPVRIEVVEPSLIDVAQLQQREGAA